MKTFKLIGFLIFIILASGHYGCKDGTIDFSRSAKKITKLGSKQIKKQRKAVLKRKKGDPGDGRVPLDQYRVNNEFTVIGIEPNWSLLRDGELHYFHYYNLLSALVAGDYDINPLTGLPRYSDAIYEPITNGMFDMAVDDNSMIQLFTKVTMHGDYGASPSDQLANSRVFFRAADIHQVFIDSIINHKEFLSEIYGIRNMGRFGIYLSFRNIPSASGNDLIRFVGELRNQGGPIRLMLELPSEFAERRFFTDDIIRGLDDNIDHYVLQGYPYFLPDTPTSVSIIHSTLGDDLSGALEYYRSVGINMKKLSVDFPQHAVVYERDGDLYRISTDRPFIPVIEARNRVQLDMNRREEPVEIYYQTEGHGSAFYKFQDGTVMVFEDDKSLEAKYRWLRDSAGVAGVSLENLSYMSTIQDETVWRVVAEEYGVIAQRIGRAILAFVMLFMIGGIAYSNVRYWQVRNIVAKELMHKLYQLIGLVIFFAVFAWALGWISSTVALILVAIPIIYMMWRQIKRRMKKFV